MKRLWQWLQHYAGTIAILQALLWPLAFSADAWFNESPRMVEARHKDTVQQMNGHIKMLEYRLENCQSN